MNRKLTAGFSIANIVVSRKYTSCRWQMMRRTRLCAAILTVLCLLEQTKGWQAHDEASFRALPFASEVAAKRHTWSDRSVSGSARQEQFRRLLQDVGAEPTGIAAWNPRTHGYVASISMGLVGPLAVVVSRNFREFQPVWIWVHVPLAFAAFIGGILGVIFGGKLPDDPGFVDSVYNAHKGIGGAAVALFGIQILMGVLRPKPVHKRRWLFNIAHHWTGRLAIVLAITNVYLGLHLAEELYKFWWGYAICLGAIMLLWLTKELIDFFAVLSCNRRGVVGSKPVGPVNGSFASVFLLHNRPQPGEPLQSSKADQFGSGYNSRSDGVQLSSV